MRTLASAVLLTAALCATGHAASYPVSGKWGESTSTEKGAIDCDGKRVIAFSGDQRHDSNGGVPDYRNVTVTPQGATRFRVVDTFANAQVSNPHTEYTLQQIDADHIELQMQSGTIKLQRCR